jgi:hypothetical protein
MKSANNNQVFSNSKKDGLNGKTLVRIFTDDGRSNSEGISAQMPCHAIILN